MQAIPCQFVDNDLTDAERAIIFPKRQTIQASGLDLASAHKEEIQIMPLERKLIPTGVAIALPVGLEAHVRSRSGLALKHGVVVLNSPGTIDADYRGELKVILVNLSHEPFTVSFGMRIAQLVIVPVVLPELMLVANLSESTRGKDGFGSTGLGDPYV